MSIIKRGLICVVIAAHLCACTHVPVASESQRVVSKEERARMGTVGVLALATPQSELEVEAWGAAHGAGKGAGKGAKFGILVPLEGCVSDPRGFAFAICLGTIILAPEVFVGLVAISTVISTVAGAVTGAVVGAVQSVPKDKAGEIEARLRAILAEDHPHEKLRFSVVAAAAEFGVQDVSEITADIPTVPGQDIDYRRLSDAKVDSIIEVGLMGVSLSGSSGADPDISLNFNAVARLEDAKSNVELSRHNFTYQAEFNFTYRSEPRKFSEWNADGARLIKEEMESAYRSLGQSIVNKILLIEPEGRLDHRSRPSDVKFEW